MSFLCEHEKNKTSFLDAEITRQNDEFVTPVYLNLLLVLYVHPF